MSRDARGHDDSDTSATPSAERRRHDEAAEAAEMRYKDADADEAI